MLTPPTVDRCFRQLGGSTKENDGFQQTRGVIRLMQMGVSNLWSTGRADALELLHPYDLDLNDSEEIDAKNIDTDASDATRLMLLVSLSTTAGAVNA
jgi:hypothetical protein